MIIHILEIIFKVYLWLSTVELVFLLAFLLTKKVKQLQVYLRALYSPYAWNAYILPIELPLILLGWILIPIAAALKAYKVDPTTLNEQYPMYHWTWPIMKLWDNEDNGIVDPGYSSYTSMFMRIIYWTALRNPVDNLKIVPIICCKINSADVRFVGSFGNCTNEEEWVKLYSPRFTVNEAQEQIEKYDTKVPQWWFCWNGFYTNFYWAFNVNGHLWLFWIGWKIKPTAIYGVQSYLLPRAPSGIQLNKET